MYEEEKMTEKECDSRISMITEIETILMKSNFQWSLSYVPDDVNGSYQIWIGGAN